MPSDMMHELNKLTTQLSIFSYFAHHPIELIREAFDVACSAVRSVRDLTFSFLIPSD